MSARTTTYFVNIYNADDHWVDGFDEFDGYEEALTFAKQQVATVAVSATIEERTVVTEVSRKIIVKAAK